MARTNTQPMTRDKDTRKNFIVWYKEEFGFTADAAMHSMMCRCLRPA
jgi:hypothetical protein